MKLTPELIKDLTKGQLELLTELGDLAKKEADLTDNIETNRRQAEKAGMGREREVAKRLMDDPEFDNLISTRLIYEREQIRLKIRSVFDSLYNAGLGQLDLLKRHAANYGFSPKAKPKSN